jgi:tetratricopeptide (TPR) repeat protein
MLPSSVDEELVVEMKNSGCERIFLSAESGSDNILTILQTKESVAMIEFACAAIRRAGLYLTLLLRAGPIEEKRSDIQKTIALIRKTLPGETVILPAVYYPGSVFYEKAVLSQRIDGSAMFERKDKSLYLRSDIEMRSWIGQIHSAGSQIRRKSWYNEKNFHEHRKHTGECWVTDLLEGDYYFDEEKERSAEQCYLSLVSKYPLNPWGYLRMGKLSFRGARFETAEMHFTKVTELLPQYYGGWLKLAESRIAQGKKREGKESIQRAFDLNQWDLRITSLIKGL